MKLKELSEVEILIMKSIWKLGDDITTYDIIEYLKEHYLALKNFKGEYIALLEIRGIASWYLKGFKNVKEYKVKLTQVNSENDFFNLLKEIINNKEIVRN